MCYPKSSPELLHGIRCPASDLKRCWSRYKQSSSHCPPSWLNKMREDSTMRRTFQAPGNSTSTSLDKPANQEDQPIREDRQHAIGCCQVDRIIWHRSCR